MKGIKGVFGLKDHLDLFKKLEREHASLVADPSDADAAYNFFSTAWHLLEWKYAGRANAPVRDGIRDSTPLLQICEDLAVGAKHFEPEAARHQSVASSDLSGVWAPGFWAPGVWAKGTWGEWFSIKLSGDAEKKYGPTIKAEHLSKHVMDYWKANI
jgi:hypothetical protein